MKIVFLSLLAFLFPRPGFCQFGHFNDLAFMSRNHVTNAYVLPPPLTNQADLYVWLHYNNWTTNFPATMTTNGRALRWRDWAFPDSSYWTNSFEHLGYSAPYVLLRELNGHAAVRFHPTNAMFWNGATTLGQTLNLGGSNTVIAVMRVNSEDTFNSVIWGSNAVAAVYNWWGWKPAPSGQLFYGIEAIGEIHSFNVATDLGNWNYYEWTLDTLASPAAHYFQNGDDLGDGGGTMDISILPTFYHNMNAVGGSPAGNGGAAGSFDLAELIIWRRVLSTDEREGVRDYLNKKYGLPP